MPKDKSSDWIRRYCVDKEHVLVMNTDEQAISFTSGVTGGVSSHELFQVNGLVLCTMFGVCGQALTGTSATLSMGTAGSLELIMGDCTATDIDAGDVVVDETAKGESEEVATGVEWILSNSIDLAYDVNTADIDSGQITFYCLWYGLSDDAYIVPSGSNATT